MPPEAGIGADVITGFPGETDALFEETYAFLAGLPVSYLHVFTYSERQGTPAASSEARVEPKVRFARNERLRMLGLKKRHAFQAAFLGRELPILLEHPAGEEQMSGLSANYLRVRVPGGTELANALVTARITALSDDHCLGEIRRTNASTTNEPVLMAAGY